MIAGSRLAASMLAVALVGGGLVARAVGSAPGRVSLRVVSDEAAGRVIELRGLPDDALGRLAANAPRVADWQEAFALFVDDTANVTGRPPAVLASYVVEHGRVRLVPRFPLTPGVSYRMRVAPDGVRKLTGVSVHAVEDRFAIPAVHPERTTRIVGVFPSTPSVPANLLRWYIEFSAPMEPGSALAHVRLLDASGREVPQAFLGVGEELWSPDRRRLTLLFDPGRVKRGIRTNLEAGAPLIDGRRYRLSIDAEWRDGRGAALTSGFDHPFEVGPDDRTSPDPTRWTAHAPAAGTRDALRVQLTEPMDHALVGRMLSLVDSKGRVVAGRAAPGDGDTSWSFVPDAAWTPGRFDLHADPLLEDLAGNNIQRVFDADLSRPSTGKASATRVTFEVR